MTPTSISTDFKQLQKETRLRSRLRDEFDWALTLVHRRLGKQSSVPLFTASAVRWVRGWLKPTHRIFEWGSGRSTLFFAPQVQSIDSVEYDSTWYEKIRGEINEQGLTNVNLIFCPPDDAYDPAFSSTSPHMANRSFSKYCALIGRNNPGYDLIVVDGRARAACLLEARTSVKQGGAIVLDDAQRHHYQEAIGVLVNEGWIPQWFFGPRLGTRVRLKDDATLALFRPSIRNP